MPPASLNSAYTHGVSTRVGIVYSSTPLLHKAFVCDMKKIFNRGQGCENNN